VEEGWVSDGEETAQRLKGSMARRQEVRDLVPLPEGPRRTTHDAGLRDLVPLLGGVRGGLLKAQRHKGTKAQRHSGRKSGDLVPLPGGVRGGLFEYRHTVIPSFTSFLLPLLNEETNHINRCRHER
jgi:hypothetical protein